MLTAVAHDIGNHDAKCTPVVRVARDKVEWFLPKRKNQLRPTSIFRTCWCKACDRTCPLHVTGKFVNEIPRGERVFPSLSKEVMLQGMRAMLAALGVDQAALYRTHDLRRGHADDIRALGGNQHDLCKSGDRKPGSKGYLPYLWREQMAMELCHEAHDP